MREARQRDQWMHTAQLMALVANAHSDTKKQSFKWTDFYPFKLSAKERPKPIKVGIGALRVFVDRKALPKEVMAAQ